MNKVISSIFVNFFLTFEINFKANLKFYHHKNLYIMLENTEKTLQFGEYIILVTKMRYWFTLN
jgi:hypothetical protein